MLRKTFGLLMIICALAFTAALPELIARGHGDTGALLLAFPAGGVAMRRGRSFRQLQQESMPQNAGEPEFYRDILYDTQTYTDNSTVQLVFFGALQADSSLGNMPQGGSLPMKTYFKIREITCDAYAASGFVTTAAGGVAGAINDLGLLIVQGRPTITFFLNEKGYGPWPLAACRGLGGPQGFGWGTFTAEESLQYATNGRPGDGLFLDDEMTIPELTQFKAIVSWPAAVDLTGDHKIRIGLRGTRFRRVS